jgi:sigma-B regulation protein RsbU (phosphoserine phosphatase)
MLAGKADVQQILDVATHELVETMSLKASGLRLLDVETGELMLASVAGLSKSYLDKGPVLLDASVIDQAALAGQSVYIADCRTDPRIIYKDMAKQEGLISCLVTGVAFRGKRIGVLRAYMDREHRFTPFEVSLLEAIAAQLAATIMHARLRANAREAERLERQVLQAAEVQRRMIPASAPNSSHYRFGCVYEPSSELGGDFYDFIKFENGDLGAVVADVVGKGLPASLMMASARSALRSHARRVTDMSEIIGSVNGRLHHDTLPGEFATAFYMELSEDGRLVKYCNAGHEPMLLLRGGEITSLEVGGMALGIDPGQKYEIAEVALEPDDVLLLYTDGITEARDFSDKAFGRERLFASLKLHAGLAPDMPVDLLAKQILWDVRRFVGLAPQTDDITIVAVRVS